MEFSWLLSTNKDGPLENINRITILEFVSKNIQQFKKSKHRNDLINKSSKRAHQTKFIPKMQIISTSCISLLCACFILNFGHNAKANPLPSTADSRASNAPAVSDILAQQQKSMMSLINADKLDLPAAVADDTTGVQFEKEAAAKEDVAGSRKTRQVIFPYSGNIYSGYPYYYPYSSYYTYRPYYYYKPIYSYGLPFYHYG